MENTNIIIKTIKVNNYKNVSSVIHYVGEKGIVFKGRNGIGKSNTLNAAFWCLTGYDLSNSCDLDSFVPKQLRDVNAGVVIDVEVELNVGKIRRVVEKTSKGLATTIYINDIQAETLKLGEAEIDKMLGLLEFTFNNYSNKDFSMRRFAMNPYYMFTLAPKTLRDVIVKRYSKVKATKDINEVLNSEFLWEAIKGNTDFNENMTYEELLSVDARLLATKKQNDALLGDFQKTRSVLLTLGDVGAEKALKKLDAIIVVYQKDNMVVEANERIVANAILELEKIYSEKALKKNPLVKVNIFQTTKTGIEKAGINITNDNEIEIKQVSTSESIHDSLEVMLDYFKAVGLKTNLPIFIDKAESINRSLLEQFSDTHHQLLITQVVEATDNKIKAEVL